MPGWLIGLMPDSLYGEGRRELGVGDLVALYTDGVVEALNDGGEMFGFERLLKAGGARMFLAASQELRGALDLLFGKPHIVSMMIQPLAFAGRGGNLAEGPRMTIPEVMEKSRATAGGEEAKKNFDFFFIFHLLFQIKKQSTEGKKSRERKTRKKRETKEKKKSIFSR